MESIQELTVRFAEAFPGRSPTVLARAPGRVNLIGEHTDYNDGFVLPIAIDRWAVFVGAPRADGRVEIASLDYGNRTSFLPGDSAKEAGATSWANYPKGVAWALAEKGYRVAGVDAILRGNVPLASGLSSSAALEVAAATLFEAIAGYTMDVVATALLCQRAENAFVGVNCGIMDQFVSRLARKGHALLIDCRSLEYRHVPMPSSGYRFVVADTGKRRSLVGSEYNARRSQCEEAVAYFAARRPGVKALRDVTLPELDDAKDDLHPVVYRRARHVITENDRTLRAVEHLSSGDMAAFGRLMVASHESLRDDYEVSCRELDVIVEEALRIPGVLGSRMTGAGFGGCTVTLATEDAVEQFRQEVPARYSERCGLEAQVYVFEAADGASWQQLGGAA